MPLTHNWLGYEYMTLAPFLDGEAYTARYPQEQMESMWQNTSRVEIELHESGHRIRVGCLTAMRYKPFRTVLLSLFLLGTAFAMVAQAAEGGGEGAPSQNPVQVIVQIIVTAIVLKILGKFDLP